MVVVMVVVLVITVMAVAPCGRHHYRQHCSSSCRVAAVFLYHLVEPTAMVVLALTVAVAAVTGEMALVMVVVALVALPAKEEEEEVVVVARRAASTLTPRCIRDNSIFSSNRRT